MGIDEEDEAEGASPVEVEESAGGPATAYYGGPHGSWLSVVTGHRPWLLRLDAEEELDSLTWGCSRTPRRHGNCGGDRAEPHGGTGIAAAARVSLGVALGGRTAWRGWGSGVGSASSSVPGGGRSVRRWPVRR